MCNVCPSRSCELQNLARWQTVASQQRTDEQIEDLTREAMGFSEKRGDSLMLLTRRSIAVTKVAENCRSATASVYRSVTGCRPLVAGTAVAWLLWRKAVRPQLTRRAEA